MSTPTPTSDAGAAPPAWLPDEATLARLASRLYGELNVAGASLGSGMDPAQVLSPLAEALTPPAQVLSPPAQVLSPPAGNLSPPAGDLSQPAGVPPQPAGVLPQQGIDLPGMPAPPSFAVPLSIDPVAEIAPARGAATSGATMPGSPGLPTWPPYTSAAPAPARALSVPGLDFPAQPGLAAPSALPAFAVPSTLDTIAEVAPARTSMTPSAAKPAPQTSVPSGPPYAVSTAAQPSFYFIHERSPMATAVAAQQPAASMPYDVERVRRDFPILQERVNGRRLVWLDNAATTQKPQAVIDRLAYFYAHENSNIHRGAHALAARATDAYEGARAITADYLGASSADSIVFTRGTTEAINLVAQAWGPRHVAAGDEIVISHLEHHANIVPWQQLAEQTGALLKIIPVDDAGQLMLDDYQALLSDRTRVVAIAQVSNVLGTVTPVAEVIEAAHRAGACVVIDGAQAVAHMPVDVTAMDADFYAFSGHKVFGPTGIGALYARPEIIEEMPPWQGGGNMIRDVQFERTTYNVPPARFEAGTGNIADAVGLGTALDYVSQLGLPAVASYEHQLLEYATGEMSTVPGLRLIGTAPEKASVLTFVLDGYEPDDLGSALDKQGIAVRAGHHCAQPILRRYGLEAAVRPSLALYNTRGEVDVLVAALRRLAADKGRR
jgi:cysteine desulfurase / selenocysteine lyase